MWMTIYNNFLKIYVIFSTYITSILIDIGRHQRTVKIARMRKNALKENARVLDRENEFFSRVHAREILDCSPINVVRSAWFLSSIHIGKKKRSFKL